MSDIETLYLKDTGRFELEDGVWRYCQNGMRWIVKNKLSCYLNCILSETNDKFCIDLSDIDCNVSVLTKKTILDWLEDGLDE